MGSPDDVIYCFDCNGLHVEGECTHSDAQWVPGFIQETPEEDETVNQPWGRLFDFRVENE